MDGPRDTNGVKISTRFWFANLKLRYRLEDLDTKRRVILKGVLGWEAWTELIWLRKCVGSGRLLTW